MAGSVPPQDKDMGAVPGSKIEEDSVTGFDNAGDSSRAFVIAVIAALVCGLIGVAIYLS